MILNIIVKEITVELNKVLKVALDIWFWRDGTKYLKIADLLKRTLKTM